MQPLSPRRASRTPSPAQPRAPPKPTQPIAKAVMPSAERKKKKYPSEKSSIGDRCGFPRPFVTQPGRFLPKTVQNPLPKLTNSLGRKPAPPTASFLGCRSKGRFCAPRSRARGWARSDAPHLPPTPPSTKGNTKSSFSCPVQAEGGEIILGLGLFAQSNMFLVGFAVCRARSRPCLSPRREAGWEREAGIATVPARKK